MREREKDGGSGGGRTEKGLRKKQHKFERG